MVGRKKKKKNTLKKSICTIGLPRWCRVKNSAASTGDTRDAGPVPLSGISPGIGNGYLLQYSCLENSMDRGAWQALVHGVAKSWTLLSMADIHCMITDSYALSQLWHILRS